MTAQRSDLIYIGIYKYPINTEPLSVYIESMSIKPKFMAASTACWRGYIATWEIIDSKLYLIELDATTENYAKRDVNFLFPGQQKVFAEWFSGTIEALGGDLIEYHHQGYSSKYKYSYKHTFISGVLIDKEILNNELNAKNHDLKSTESTIQKKFNLWTSFKQLKRLFKL
jgi:hypothetical protein